MQNQLFSGKFCELHFILSSLKLLQGVLLKEELSPYAHSQISAPGLISYKAILKHIPTIILSWKQYSFLNPSSHFPRKHLFFFQLKLISRQFQYCCWNLSLLSCLRFYLLYPNNCNRFFSSQTLIPQCFSLLFQEILFHNSCRGPGSCLLSFTDLAKGIYLLWPGSQWQKQWNNPGPLCPIYKAMGAVLVSSRPIPHSVHVTKLQYWQLQVPRPSLPVCQILLPSDAWYEVRNPIAIRYDHITEAYHSESTHCLK